jgi:hypothetical protein
MSKTALLARTFLNDKDVYDMLKSGSFSKQGLLRFLRGWGVLLSSNDEWEDIARYVSTMSLGWDDVYALAAQCDSADRIPRGSTKRVLGVWDDDVVDNLIAEGKKAFSNGGRQVWTPEKQGDKLKITISDIITNHSVAKFGQRTEISTEVVIEKTAKGFTIRNQQIEASTNAAQWLFKKLSELSKKPAVQEKIELTGVRDPVLRSEFFMKLHRGLKGYRPVDTLDVKIDRRLPTVGEDGDADKDGVPDFEEEEEQIKGMVKCAALSGTQLLTSDLYQRLKSSGFYICSLTWTAIESKGDRKIDFEAGFGKPVEATNFSYGVKRVHPTVKEQEEGATLGELLRREGSKHSQAVEEAAYETMAFISKKLADPDYEGD